MNETEALSKKVGEWLKSEGYPTEFQVANIFAKSGFHVRQSQFVRDVEENIPREIDVVADINAESAQHSLLRISHVVECKWSQDKPWVALCGRHGTRMAPSACITQSFASSLANAILWADAGNPELEALSLFATPEVPGFGGRQAFSKGHDVFYGAMSSIVSAAHSKIAQYKEEKSATFLLPRIAVVAFPLIVVDGKLFKAAYDADEGEVTIAETKSVRFHWRGSAAWPHHASVDIVTLEHANEFVEQRRKDVEILIRAMRAKHEELIECYKSRSMTPLKITDGPRGIIGRPQLLQRLQERRAIPRSRAQDIESRKPKKSPNEG